ncbi:hypothetical protein FVEN_g12940 [Fusarium venenatum]|nr:hypothetical protein FVEN_g12940 [Fusarium venenatum]
MVTTNLAGGCGYSQTAIGWLAMISRYMGQPGSVLDLGVSLNSVVDRLMNCKGPGTNGKPANQCHAV